MTEQFSCPNCGPITSTIIKPRLQTFPVKGEKTTVTSLIRFCTKCGTDIYDKELDSEALAKAYYQYRTKHNIVSPADIRRLRETYGLTQRGLSALLGYGEITVHRYENGSIPDEVHNQLFRLIGDPLNLQRILDERHHLLNPRTERKLRNRVAALIADDAPKKMRDIMAIVAKNREAGPHTGFKRYSPEALMEMMVFFAAKGSGIFKTKLNKLLWYSDFLHFHRESVSISGAKYVHLTYGPVPDNYDFCLSLLTQDQTLIREEVLVGPDTVREELIATRSYDPEVFSASAIETMEAVLNKLGKHTSKVLSDLSHKEKGYLETRDGQPISYEYADCLNVKFLSKTHNAAKVGKQNQAK